MAEKPQSSPAPSSLTPAAPAPARRGSAFRGGDGTDPMVELTERAKVISQEAGTKVSTAMRDMISAAAGIAGFAVESARDLVQYMVRRGQMTQEEADRLIREAEASHMKRPAAERAKLTASKIAAEKAAAAKKAAMIAANLAPPPRPLVPRTVVAPPAPRVTPAPSPTPVAKAVAPEKTAATKAPKAETAKATNAPAKGAVKVVAKAPAKAAKKPAAKPPKKAAAKKRR